MWVFYALLSAFFAALTAIFGKIGVTNINSNLATAIRTIVVLVLIWMIVFMRGEAKGISSISKYNLTFLIFSGVASGLSWLFYYRALQIGNVSQVATIDKLSIAIVIIFSALFLNETITFKTAIGAGLVMLGALVLAIK